MRAQIGVARGNRPTGTLGRDRPFLNPLPSRLPGVVPALTVPGRDLLQDPMGFVEIGTAELRHVHDASGNVIRPTLIVGKIAKHRHSRNILSRTLQVLSEQSNAQTLAIIAA